MASKKVALIVYHVTVPHFRIIVNKVIFKTIRIILKNLNKVRYYSKYNPDPNLEVIERRFTPEGKVGQTCYKCRRCGQIINHWECLFCQEEDWKKQGLIKQNKVK
jgi:hypothetical protein